MAVEGEGEIGKNEKATLALIKRGGRAALMPNGERSW